VDFALTKQQKDIMRAAREFAEGEFPDRAQEFDREEMFDYEIWKKAAELGFVGMSIGEAYGGAGMGVFECALVMEEFWAVDAGTGVALFTNFGSEILDLYGTKEQKNKLLPPLAGGEAIMSVAITEPDAGSDVAAATTTAVKEGDEYIINGTKTFITHGNVANFVVAFCQTDPENPDRHKRHSWIIVETDREGFEANKLRGKLGIRASDTAEISFSNVRVPAENLVGKEGAGFKELMTFFDISRIFISSHAVGTARAALEEAIKYTKKRQQFGMPVASFQATQFKLAEMATMVKAARNLCYEAAWKADNGALDPELIAMAKWYAAKTAVQCADEALQMHGGYGYLDEYRVQRIYRDAKILEIYEGTKEMEKLIIARSLLR
jgi:acyl-CoA dehydrogenase